jgi:hypothetical protein
MCYRVLSDYSKVEQVMLEYTNQSSNVDECSPNKLYYNKANSDITTKFGYYWAFDGTNRCFYPAICDYPESKIIIESGRTFDIKVPDDTTKNNIR